MVKTVKIYSKEGCGACISAKTFMNNKNIPFEAIDIDVNEEAMEELKQMGAMSLPYIKIGDKEIIGFKPMKILDALK